MASYAVFTDTGIRIADITKTAGDEMITGYDGRWVYSGIGGPGRKWVFECDLAYTAKFHQARIYIGAGYYMRLED